MKSYPGWLLVLAGHPQPLRVWVLCLYLMGLNLSSRQIAMRRGAARWRRTSH